MLASLWTDIRFAARRLRGDLLLTLTAVLTLSLGLGSAVVMTDTLDRLLVRAPEHVTSADRITRLYVGRESGFESVTDYSTFERLENELVDEIEAATAYFTRSFSLGRGAEARPVEAVAHSPGYFATLGVTPVLGSLNMSADSDAATATIGYGLWQNHFGGSADVLGRTLELGTDIYTITGVLPRGFAGVDFTTTDIWVPLAVAGVGWMGNGWRSQPSPWLNVVARLKPGVDREAAGVHAATVVQGMDWESFYGPRTFVFGDLKRSPDMPETTRVALWIGAVAVIVLLIACGNVANLLYIRGLRRMHETAVQAALGASRGRLMRGFLLESTLLAAAAGLAAFATVVSAGTIVRQLFLPTVAAVVPPLDPRLIGITVLASIVAMLLFGLMPAFRLTTERMMLAGRAAKRERPTVLRVFTAAQVALAVPLLVAAGLFVLSYANAVSQNLGFDQHNVVVVETNLFEVGGDFDATTASHKLLRAELESMPEIEAAAMVQYEPWQSPQGFEFVFSIAGRELPSGPRSVPANKVDPAFFEVMRLPLVEGRFFTDAENVEGARPVAVISETMARTIADGESPLGQCIRIGSPAPPGVSRDEPACTEIIGVVGDARWSPAIRPTGQPEQMIFRPLEQEAGTGALGRSILARTRTDAGALVPQIRQRLLAATRSLPYIDVRTFEETFAPLLRPWQLGATIFVVFGALALLIAAVGLIVVTSHDVTRRSHEFAVRSACGAQAGELVRTVLSRSVGTFAAGLTVGLLAAWFGARLLEALLFDIAAADVRVFGAATLSWLACALVAAWLPARRAARIDPATALRSE